MRQAWTTGTATLAGEHYQVSGAIVRPLPLQPGGLPIWVAGGGERVTLHIAARFADYTNFDGTLEGFSHKSDVLAGHCREVGRDFGAITRSANYNVVVGATAAEVEDRLDAVRDRLLPHLGEGLTRRQVESLRAGTAAGTPEQVVERLDAVRRAGLAYAIFYFPELAFDRSGLELFEAEVLPALR
jgi:alkanesulfonate monooxygenase SsuD/methylene tetrahydromethanopterin reductase-like flavin-dependent oxidoreductase (luciferase family)